MSESVPPADNQPQAAAATATHNLSWIAMVVMAGMCLATLIFAASLNID